MLTTKRDWLRAACAILSALLVCLIVLNFARSEALTNANNRVSAVYQKAFYETCQLTEGISVNYRKLLVASDNGRMQTLLGEISRQCQGALSNLALLPLDGETISATLKFINQAEDFADTLSVKLASGDGVAKADYDAMLALSDGAAAFSKGLGDLLRRFENGEISFESVDFEPDSVDGLAPLTGSASDYPTLLYDGPFSDGITAGNYAMLSGASEVTAEQAAQALKAFIPVDTLEYLGESCPEIPCYEFSVQSNGVSLSAGVTKYGGHALYLLAENPGIEAGMSAEQLCQTGADFLRAKGYGDVELCYYSIHNGVITINFAAKQDGVILYPDLIKLQLSMKDASVVGFDAYGYLKNHRPRTLPEAKIDARSAMTLAGSRLEPLSARLCLIPQNQSEHLCYEVAARDGEDRFLAYIDARSGVERELMQLLSNENGTLVM